jgi:hypothetical protein
VPNVLHINNKFSREYTDVLGLPDVEAWEQRFDPKT